jgi:xylem cysteine proteinase
MNYELQFLNFMSMYGKKYSHDEEHLARFEVFKTNMQTIDEHNAKNLGWQMGVNEFADMTWEEFKAGHLGLIQNERKNGSNAVSLEGMVTVPTSVDWNAKGVVTTPKTQGNCGGCWSFATTGSVEGVVAIKTGQLTSLSEQQLIDCSTKNSGCNGGVLDYAMQFVIQTGGLCTEASYPYLAKQGTCKTCTKVSKISSYQDVTANSEAALLAAAALNPVMVAIEANQNAFQFYSGGVMTGVCGTKLDHGVLVTGFGTYNGQDYWTIKNSWGPTWGEKGFIRIARGKQLPYGQCGIAMQPVYPVA